MQRRVYIGDRELLSLPVAGGSQLLLVNLLKQPSIGLCDASGQNPEYQPVLDNGQIPYGALNTNKNAPGLFYGVP